MKKSLFLLTATLLLSASFCKAVDIDWGNLPANTIIKAVSVFEKDPGYTDGKVAAAVILNFSEESTNVTVSLSADLMPWMKVKPEINNSDLLLTGFIGGNIRHQLENKVNKDQPVDGILSMCKVYDALRKDSLIKKMDDLEKLRKLKRKEVEKLVGERQRKAKEEKKL